METDDSDSDLPPAFEIQHQVVKNNDYKEDDIIWVKYKKFFWPAVVLHVKQREKKLKVMFVDAPSKNNHLLIPFTRATAYWSEKGRTLQAQDERMPNSELVESFQSAKKKVEEFLLKRVTKNGPISPFKYFKAPLLYLGEDGSDDDDTQMCKSSGDDEVPSAEEENSSEEEPEEPLPKVERLIPPDVLEKSRVLIEAIKSEECKNYLIQVYHQKVKSKRNTTFFTSAPSVRSQLKFQCGFGPIDGTDDEMDAVCMYVLKLFDTSIHPIPPEFNKRTYVFDVWLPEAVIWSISKVDSTSLQDAEVVFENAMKQKKSHSPAAI